MDGFHDNKWFIYINDHHEGPFSMGQLQAKLEAGEVDRTQYVWAEGMPDWQLMTTVRELEPILTLAAAPVFTPIAGGTFEQEPSIDFSAPAAEPSISPSIEIEPVAAPQSVASSEPAQETVSFQSEEALQELRHERFDQEPAYDPSAPALRSEIDPQMRFTSASSEAPRSGGFLKIFLSLAILGSVSFGYVSGTLDPIFKNSRVAGVTQLIGDVVAPGFTRLAQWVPQLQRWISPVPFLSGVEPAELTALRANSQRGNPPRLAMALDRTDNASPTFYVTSALPNGTKLDLVLVGTPETLLSQTSLEAKVTAEVTHRLAKFDNIRQFDGRPIAQGEYRVYVMESESGSQTPEAESVLSALPESLEKAPADAPITGKHKLFLQKTLFLGGAKDETYTTRLKDFHDRLRNRSNEELKEIAGILQTLDQQLTSTIDEHSKISKGKTAKTSEKRWNDFHDKWTGKQTQLDTNLAGWTEALSRKEFYHWGLYQMIKLLSEKVSQLHVQQHSGVLIKPSDEREFQAQLSEKQKSARDALSDLEKKLADTQKMNEGIDGMPLRLKFEEEAAQEAAPPPAEAGESSAPAPSGNGP